MTRGKVGGPKLCLQYLPELFFPCTYELGQAIWSAFYNKTRCGTKGQLISKGLFGILNSPKKRTNEHMNLHKDSKNLNLPTLL